MKRKAPTSADDDAVGKIGSVDDVDAKQFLTFLNSLPQRPQSLDVIRFFKRKNDFNYYLYNEDAEFVADLYWHSRTGLKAWEVANARGSKAAKVEIAKFLDVRSNLLPAVLRKILERGMRIEVYSQQDRQWNLTQRATPGNLSEIQDILFSRDEMDSPAVMAAVKISISEGVRTIGVAFCDLVLRKLNISEFMDNEQLTNLESLILQVGVKEVVTLPLKDKDADAIKLKEILERCSVSITVNPRASFDPKDIQQDLLRLLGDKKPFNKNSELDMKSAMAACSCLIKANNLLSDEAHLGSWTLSVYNLTQFMRLDAAAVQALNLLPSARDSSEKHNLYGLLNKCHTAMGSRRLRQWVKQPLMDVATIEQRLDLVELFVNDATLAGEIRSRFLRSVPDLERMVKKIQQKSAALGEVASFYAFSLRLPGLLELMEQYTSSGMQHAERLDEIFRKPFKEAAENLQRFEALVEETIDPESIKEGDPVVNPKFEPKLTHLDKKKTELRGQLKKHDQEVERHLDGPNLKRESDKSFLYVYKVPKKDEPKVTKAEKDGYQVILSTKTGVKFRTPTLKTICEKLQSINQEYASVSSSIVQQIMEVVVTYVPIMEQLHDLVAQLDAILAMAETSRSGHTYVRPIIKESGQGNIVFKQLRHPVLEIQPDMNFIPNDVSLIRDKSSFAIITGPNMGGKSTYIRQAGVAVLMAQIGCFVPCDYAEVTVCDAILARVGAGDSQLRGVSTFMAEMLETATILKTATRNSLVIIDELGRGTSTYDGFGLAWAISKYICTNIESFTLFATHFHELTQLSTEIPFVDNLHVAAVPDKEKGIVLQYLVKPGASDQSFGIHVARIAKFPQEVIDMAEKKARELETFEHGGQQLLNNQRMKEQISDHDRIEGERIVEKLMKEFSMIQLEKMTREQRQHALADMKSKIDAQTNPYVRLLISPF